MLFLHPVPEGGGIPVIQRDIAMAFEDCWSPVIYDPDDPLGHLYDVNNDCHHDLGLALSHTLSPTWLGLRSGCSKLNIDQRQGSLLGWTSGSVLESMSKKGQDIASVSYGTELQPTEVDSVCIFPGHHHPVVVTANKTVENYEIRALSGVTSASLTVVKISPSFAMEATYGIPFDEGALHPFVNPGAPGIPEIGKADVNLQMALGINSSGSILLSEPGLVRKMTAASQGPGPDVLVAVMGATGTGKSTFINLLTNDEGIHIGHNPESETSNIQTARYGQSESSGPASPDPASSVRLPPSPASHGHRLSVDEKTGLSVILIDTPGFNDSYCSRACDVTIYPLIPGFIISMRAA
ncbi:hypothetical protein L210DRAFT_3651260 [Boletus edulis BED1]|uniref:G domain-containing protein n=1 Tax=Boletus edulis BED1 TaxID=1328754 RepID=A0AAD4BIE6_BOLED|nr:hypothetical protein L210DRAFT_3651260 [Boletus edulis BED1]